TFQAVVRVAHQASEQAPFPFAAGMFAEVVIPGEQIPNVIRIPREAIDSGGNVLLSNDGRLKTQPVEIVRFQGDTALISGGLKEGDILLTTRPPEVIDGMKVNVKFEDAAPVAMVADE